MKKTLTLFLLLGVLALFGCDFYGTTTTTETPADPEIHTITTVDELVAMNTTDHYVLGNDLDLGGLEWLPVGTPGDPFAGDFDGQGHTISNFQITLVNDGFAGLFGSVSGNIADTNVADFTIDVATTDLFYAGGLVAHTTGNIAGSSARGTISVANAASNTFAGLLAGYAASYTTATMTLQEFVASAVTDCYAEGSLDIASKHFAFVGGLIGKTYNIVLTDDAAVATIEARATVYRLYVGGLVGHAYGGLLSAHADSVDDAVFETLRCYADATITVASPGTKASVGGLFGYHQDAFIEDCFARADVVVIGTAIDVGGLVGELWSGSLSSSVARIGLTAAGEVDTLGFGGVAGFFHADATADAVYRLESSLVSPTVTAGTGVTADLLAAAAWYQDVLGWNAATFDLPTVIGILS